MSQFKTQEYNINELTNGEGTGSLDSLLVSLKKQLWSEYENNRIRGTDYANAYIETIKHGLGTISQYTLERAKLPLELQMMEAQLHKVATDTAVATKQGGLIDAQIYKEMAHTRQIDYETEHKLPKELELMEVKLQNDRIELELKEFELRQLRPLQLEITKQELEIKKSQLEIAIKEIAIKEQQLALARYELDVKAPAEVNSINAQAELYRQKVITEKAQTDASVIGDGSSIARSNAVLEQQAISYINDSKLKTASMLVDTWKIRRNDDPDSAPVDNINQLHDPNIGKVVKAIISDVGFI